MVQTVTVNAEAFTPLCRSPFVTVAFQTPVAAPAGMVKVQMIFVAPATVTLVAVITARFFMSLTDEEIRALGKKILD
jgi:hypothetical protein